MTSKSSGKPSKDLRGADIVMRTLEQAGASKIFTLSGNHIMSLFDAALETKLDLVHVRHEAACVHMADAWGRMTGDVGIAMVTGGPGHANAVGALYTALCAESPMVLLSGHAGTDELGRGGFQEIRQADMAAPVCKASWTARAAHTLGQDIAEALRLAKAGRPGPVHVSLPSDLLDAHIPASQLRPLEAAAWTPQAVSLAPMIASAVLADLAAAKRPLVLAGPQFAHHDGRAILGRLEAAIGVPVVLMESVRGLNDATLGAFGQALAKADLVVLLAKPLDFTLKFGEAPFVDPACRFIVLDPEAALIERAAKALGSRMVLGTLADGRASAEALITGAKAMSKAQRTHHEAWHGEVIKLAYQRPDAWTKITAKTPGRLHPLEVFRTLKPYVAKNPASVLVCDGGEFAQWAQAVLPVGRRMINSVAGAIGSGISCAVTAAIIEQGNGAKAAPVFAVMGDGTFGFHMAEFDTAVRAKAPFIAIVGNDSRWNAEHQIQLRDYGENRTTCCELLPTRYDQVVVALGGYGEMIDTVAALPAAIERAMASGKPACINIMTESIASPTAPKAPV
jgi:acetolactate synthase I/II/III large subunit